MGSKKLPREGRISPLERRSECRFGRKSPLFLFHRRLAETPREPVITGSAANIPEKPGVITNCRHLIIRAVCARRLQVDAHGRCHICARSLSPLCAHRRHRAAALAIGPWRAPFADARADLAGRLRRQPSPRGPLSVHAYARTPPGRFALAAMRSRMFTSPIWMRTAL